MGVVLQLDPGIRDWVMIPVVLVMVLVGILRDKVLFAIGRLYSTISSPYSLLGGAVNATRPILHGEATNETIDPDAFASQVTRLLKNVTPSKLEHIKEQ